jgi:hypothetical protein
MKASFDVDALEQWVSQSAANAAHGRRIVLAYSFGADDPTRLVLLTSEPQYFAEIHNIYAEEYDTRLSLGRYLRPEQAERFRSLHRSIDEYVFRFPAFNSQDRLQRQVVRDVLTDLFPSQWFARGFLLFDIVEFSLRSPAEQVSLRLVLNEAIRTAYATFRAYCPSFDLTFNLIPTGDGFYVWHDRPGMTYDAATLVVGVLTVASVARPSLAGLDLRLRTALAVDRVYTVPTRRIDDRLSPRVFRDAIGSALNVAARLCAAAAPGQILLSELSTVKADEDEAIRTSGDLVNASNELIDRPGQFSLAIDPAEVLKFADKHGEVHRCYNVNGLSFVQGTTTVSVRNVGLKRDTAAKLKADDFVSW